MRKKLNIHFFLFHQSVKSSHSLVLLELFSADQKCKFRGKLSLISIVYSNKIIIKSGNAKWRRQREWVSLAKKQLAAHFFGSFLCRCFARLQRDWNFLVTTLCYKFYGENVVFVCAPVPLFLLFEPINFPLVAATSIYHFLIVSPLLFFLYFFQRNWSPLFFISRSSSFSLIHVNRVIDSQCQLKLSRRTDDFLNWSINQIFLPILLLFKNAKAKAWALIGLSLLWGGTLRPVSNFVLLPCRTQLIELNST